jgi:methylated-DNA-[protein]-cysteine S-methyltransferase
MTVYTTTSSPLGELLLVGEQSSTERGGVALASLSMEGQKTGASVEPGWHHVPEAFEDVVRQLKAYFAGELTRFDLGHVTRGSAFQQRVWAALETIPHGTTTTYGELAQQMGVPRSGVRALGTAIGANPLLIVRPCHRVIGASGSMTGYAGGVERKRFLLTHEGALQPQLI